MTDDAEMPEHVRQIAEMQNRIMDTIGEIAVGLDSRVIVLACVGAAANVAISARVTPASFKEFMTGALEMTVDNWPAPKPRAANER